MCLFLLTLKKTDKKIIKIDINGLGQSCGRKNSYSHIIYEALKKANVLHNIKCNMISYE